MKTNRLLAITVLLLIQLLQGAARGQSPAIAADCTQDIGCTTLKEQAAERSRAGDFGEALRLYKLAHEVRPDPRLLFNIARLLHKQGKLAEAVPYYQKFITAPIQDEEQQQKAREYVEQIQSEREAPSKQIKTPVYKKWWFWTIIGGVVAAGVVAGVAGGVVASQRLPEPVVRPFGS